ncbi:MAG: C4-dicarboxylate ABC transporter permease [SAR116 cluster bacterium]|nr:C4-dicarboxylate ABC transporter permease [SAR116 cluster bacterium]|tara:strand:- start:53 stop:976 length:924 start_codon:yes stop_codon:yes gene_type:complete
MDTESSSGLLSGILWFVQGLFYAVANLFTAISNPQLWLDWSDKQALMRFIYYGGSTELFFVFLLSFFIIVAVGWFSPRFMWGFVRMSEGLSNTVGRLIAWGGLIMVIQQVVIVFLQRIFARPDIVIGFGIPIEYGVSWFAEELKLYNAAIICLCISYTFVQGGHVRVDLFYAPASFRKKKIIDMCGALFFMIPMAALMWLYSWFFMWRHLITPKVSASDKIELMLRKAKVLKWNVETIGFSANGFSAYFLFKVLMVAMVAFIFLQAVSFFCRSLAEYREGEKSDGKFLDLDGKEPAPVADATPQQTK